tara:strand:- start:13363 stop:13731 length:369 start_codon:yes stop_codon:yes gene_type:complete
VRNGLQGFIAEIGLRRHFRKIRALAYRVGDECDQRGLILAVQSLDRLHGRAEQYAGVGMTAGAHRQVGQAPTLRRGVGLAFDRLVQHGSLVIGLAPAVLADTPTLGAEHVDAFLLNSSESAA